MQQLYNWLRKIGLPKEEKNNYSAGYWSSLLRKETMNICQGKKGRLLEVGCGEGLFIIPLAQNNPQLEIWGIDFNNERIELAKKRKAEKAINNLHLCLQEAQDLEFEDSYFDIVVCINVLLSLPSITEVERVISQMARVCKKNGIIIFEFRNSLNALLRCKYALAKYYDRTVANQPLRSYNINQIEKILLRQDLVIKEKRYLGFPSGRFAPLVLVVSEKNES